MIKYKNEDLPYIITCLTQHELSDADGNKVNVLLVQTGDDKTYYFPLSSVEILFQRMVNGETIKDEIKEMECIKKQYISENNENGDWLTGNWHAESN